MLGGYNYLLSYNSPTIVMIPIYISFDNLEIEEKMKYTDIAG